MKLKSIDYDLPEELIAQQPLRRRDDSRLMVIDPANNLINHLQFLDIGDQLQNGDLLVFNDSKVIPARLYGFKEETYAHVELLLLGLPENSVAFALTKNSRAVKKGSKIIFAKDFYALALSGNKEGIIKYQFFADGDVVEAINKVGELPLPPYIKNYQGDRQRYQTVYAKELGSVAAPTAGLHFTPALLEQINNRKIKIAYVTLHVGLGTFKPVTTPYLKQHKMHEELYSISKESAILLNKALMNSDRIIAVGTTTLRALETNYRKHRYFTPTTEMTNIFIYPPQEVLSVDLLITNFHQPKSTLLLLVMALAGEKMIKKAYQEAIKKRYRFLSFGDACLIANNLYADKRLISNNMALQLNITKAQIAGKKPRLLLHVCCAPCLMQALDFLIKYYQVTLIYENSNISPLEEYNKRLTAIKEYLAVFNVENKTAIELIVPKYIKSFNKMTDLYPEVEERNFRCFNCIEKRFKAVYSYFKKNRYKYDFIMTTLTASVFKATAMVNEIGLNVFKQLYIPTNFRPSANLENNAAIYQQALNTYRQKYCGCNVNALLGFSKLGLKYDQYLKTVNQEELEPSEKLQQWHQHRRRGDQKADLFANKKSKVK